MMSNMKALRSVAGPAIALASLVSMVAFGIVGVGRVGVSNGDGAVLFAAGRAWLAGLNPYVHENLVRSVAGLNISLQDVFFFYPPQAAALCLPLAIFDYPAAKLIWLLINLVSIALISFMLIQINSRHAFGGRNKLDGWVISAITMGNPFTAHVLWLGQTSLFAFAATLGAWFYSREKNGGLQVFVWAWRPSSHKCASCWRSGFYSNAVGEFSALLQSWLARCASFRSSDRAL
jgi:hypothetical protein